MVMFYIIVFLNAQNIMFMCVFVTQIINAINE